MSCLNGAAVRAMTAAATPSPEEGFVEPGAEPKCSKLGVGKERGRDLPGTVDAGHGLPQKSPRRARTEGDLPNSSRYRNSSHPPRRMGAVQ